MNRLRSSVAAASKMMRMITASSLSSPQPLRRFNISISPPQLNPIRPFASTSQGSRFFSTRGRSSEMSFSSDEDEDEDEDEDGDEEDMEEDDWGTEYVASESDSDSEA